MPTGAEDHGREGTASLYQENNVSGASLVPEGLPLVIPTTGATVTLAAL